MSSLLSTNNAIYASRDTVGRGGFFPHLRPSLNSFPNKINLTGEKNYFQIQLDRTKHQLTIESKSYVSRRLNQCLEDDHIVTTGRETGLMVLSIIGEEGEDAIGGMPIPYSGPRKLDQ